MMDIVRPVSNKSFQMTNAARQFIFIQRRFVFVTKSMKSLKALSMIEHYILIIAIVHTDGALITVN